MLNGLLGLYMAEDANMLERTVLTDSELDGVLAEAASLDPSDPVRQEFVNRVNKRAKGKSQQQSVVPTDD